MFVPKIAKPQTKAAASSTNSLAHNRSTQVPKQSIGNQATLRFLAQRTSTNGSGEHQEPVVDRDAHPTRGLSWTFGKIPIYPPDQSRGSEPRLPLSARLMPAILQRKLIVGEVDDPLEHEADRVADQVMRFPDRALSIGPAPLQVSRKCAACEEDEQLRRKRSDAAETAAAAAPALVHEVLRALGQTLDAATRAYFEPRFRQDFSRVQVHAGPQAAAAAKSVQARAFTVGHHVVFGAGHFAPGSSRRAVSSAVRPAAGSPVW